MSGAASESLDDVLGRLHTSKDGLTGAEAERRRAESGPNELALTRLLSKIAQLRRASAHHPLVIVEFVKAWLMRRLFDHRDHRHGVPL